MGFKFYMSVMKTIEIAVMVWEYPSESGGLAK
jgi:hypothetical protein